MSNIFFKAEIRGIHDGILIIQAILSHECRRIHRRSHEHSLNYWLLFSRICNVRHSFLSFSHLIFYFIRKFCCVITHDENFGICHFLGVSTIRLPWLRTLRIAHLRRERVFMMRVNLLHFIPRIFLRFLRAIVRRSPTFPLLRRPRTVIIQFWITCWWESIRLPWSIIYNNRFPRILISVPSLHRAWWSWRRHDRWHPRSEIHHRSWFCCDSFFSWFLLNSFRHCSRANCGTEMANVKQIQQMIPFIRCEISFGQYVCELVFGDDVFDLDFGIQIDSIEQPIKSNSVGSGNMSHCRTPSFNDHLDHCFIVFKHIQWSFLTRRLDIWGNRINVFHHIDLPLRFMVLVNIIIRLPWSIWNTRNNSKNKNN